MKTYRQVPTIESRMEPHEFGVWILKQDALDLVRIGKKLAKLSSGTMEENEKTKAYRAKALAEWNDKLEKL